MGQVVQLVGALLVVGAYVAASQHRLRFDSVQFLAMNVLGAGILAVVAALNRDFGFLLLEGVWVWVAGRGLRRAIKAKEATKREKKRKPPGRFSPPGAGPTRPTRPARRRHRPNPLRRV